MPISITTAKPRADALIAIGTVIDVKGGRKPVEELKVGDLVRTKDNGYQPIRWIASRTLNPRCARSASRPVRWAR